MKKWNLLLLFVTIILCIAIFYMNYTIYARVIGMGFFSTMLCLSLFFGLYGLLKKEKSNRNVIVNEGFIVVIIVMFLFAMPNYTYYESQQLVASKHLDQTNVETVEIPKLDNKTVPSDGASNWLLNNRLYYVGIKENKQNQMSFYVVDPNEGKVIKLNEPYWKTPHI